MFSLAQARAGITFPYRIVVDDDVPDYIPSASSASVGVIFYRGMSIANMRVAVLIEGNGQRFCVCDQGS